MTTVEEQIEDIYETYRQRLRKAWLNYRAARKEFAEAVDKILDLIFQQHPNWSVKRAFDKIRNDNADFPEWQKEYKYFYRALHDSKSKHLERVKQYPEKGQEEKIVKTEISSSERFFSETPQETYERLEKEKAEMEADATNVREYNEISLEDQPEEIDNRYLILQDKLKKANRQIEDLKEQIKRIRVKIGFYNRGEIRLDYQKIADCLRELSEAPDVFIVTQEKGHAVEVRAA